MAARLLTYNNTSHTSHGPATISFVSGQLDSNAGTKAVSTASAADDGQDDGTGGSGLGANAWRATATPDNTTLASASFDRGGEDVLGFTANPALYDASRRFTTPRAFSA